MSEKSLVAFLEEWQTGFFLIIGTAFVGYVSGVLSTEFTGLSGFPVGFLGGAILSFVAFSYLLYGR